MHKSTNGVILRVDREKCQGHARCSALAPELFELDEYGSAREVAMGPILAETTEKAFVAQANCPENAIIIQAIDE
ncbi:ferredoxin [Bradyrhizobium sp. USDA 4449]